MSGLRLVASKIFVSGLKIDAQIGVHRHEIGRAQPLVVHVELDVVSSDSDRLADTVNYETVLSSAQEVAGQGHISLVETFAHRLAARCLADPRVTQARVRVEKPLALAPDALSAGVEITLSRD